MGRFSQPVVCTSISNRGRFLFLILLLWFPPIPQPVASSLSSSSSSSAGGRRARRAAGGTIEKDRRHYAISKMIGPGFLYTRPRGRCTPQFWSSRREPWPRMVPEMALVSKVFGSRALERYQWDLTVLEATERNDEGTNAFSHLLKQSAAALLNSYARRSSFPYTPWEVKTCFIQAHVSVKAAAHQAQLFSWANQACV